MRTRSFAVLALLLLAACTEDPAPTTTAEAQFVVNPGTGDRLFTIAVSAGNASHVIQTPLTAPYTVLMENAYPPVQGIVTTEDPDAIADLQLAFGGETVPRIAEPGQKFPGCPEGLSDQQTCVNNCPSFLAAPCVVPEPGPVEVRFDVSSVPPSALFTANVGSLNQDHLISTTTTPASVFLEDPAESASGVFTKFDQQTSLTVNLYVDGVLRDSATSGSGNTGDAVVQYQFD